MANSFSTSPTTSSYNYYSYTTASQGSTGGQNPSIDALLSGYQWTSKNDTGKTIITYSFINNQSSFTSNYSSYNEPTQKSFLSTDDQATVRTILSSIEAVCNIDFIEVDDNASTCGVIRYGYSNVVTQNNNAAWAWYPQSLPRNGDVWVSPNYNANTNNTHSFFNHLVLHETLHALGLKHPFETLNSYTTTLTGSEDTVANTVMSYSVSSNNSIRSMDQWPHEPMIYDIAALQHLYGASNTSSGDDTYDLSSTRFTDQLACIYDSGGRDTLDASDLQVGVSLNLNPGSWSNIGNNIHTSGNSYTQTLAIAASCAIEDAIGSTHNDMIYGNTRANQIDANAGDDAIYASSGIDTIDGGAGNDQIIFSDPINAYTFLRDQQNLIIQEASDISYINHIENFTFAGTSYTYTDIANQVLGSLIWSDAVIFDNKTSLKYALKNSTSTEITYSYRYKNENYTLSLTGHFDNNQSNTIDNITWQHQGVSLANYHPNLEIDQWTNHQTLLGNKSGNWWSYLLSKNDYFELSSGADNLVTYAGNDVLLGLAGNDILDGSDGDDWLDGGLGQDKLIGGAGDDTFIIDDLGDSISDSSGTDHIETALSTFSLAKYSSIELLSYTGNGDSQLTGNKLANQIQGNTGDDRIDGNLGNDILTGGAGEDHFIFSTALKNNTDTITDFVSGTDQLDLSLKIFTKLKNDTDLSDNFCINNPQDSNDYFMYHSTNHTLYYDADGIGTKVAPVAIVGGMSALQYSDIFLF